MRTGVSERGFLLGSFWGASEGRDFWGAGGGKLPGGFGGVGAGIGEGAKGDVGGRRDMGWTGRTDVGETEIAKLRAVFYNAYQR